MDVVIRICKLISCSTTSPALESLRSKRTRCGGVFGAVCRKAACSTPAGLVTCATTCADSKKGSTKPAERYNVLDGFFMVAGISGEKGRYLPVMDVLWSRSLPLTIARLKLVRTFLAKALAGTDIGVTASASYSFRPD